MDVHVCINIVYVKYECLWICFCMKVVFACDCLMKLCCFVYMYEKLLYCSHVWMAPGKISCNLTGSPSLNKVFELNCIELTVVYVYCKEVKHVCNA